MSQENVETVRNCFAAFGEGRLDALAEFWDPDISWRAVPGAVDDRGEIRGTASMRRYLNDWLDTFDDITWVADELLDVGDDRVIAVVHTTGRARLSGVETGLRYAVIFTLRGGRIVRGREYTGKAEALAAVELEK